MKQAIAQVAKNSEPASADALIVVADQAQLRLEVAKQRMRLAKEELKRARKRFKEAKREVKRARKRVSATFKASKRARKRVAKEKTVAAAMKAAPQRVKPGGKKSKSA